MQAKTTSPGSKMKYSNPSVGLQACKAPGSKLTRARVLLHASLIGRFGASSAMPRPESDRVLCCPLAFPLPRQDLHRTCNSSSERVRILMKSANDSWPSISLRPPACPCASPSKTPRSRSRSPAISVVRSHPRLAQHAPANALEGKGRPDDFLRAPGHGRRVRARQVP